jgi:hypothetical protein
MMVARIEMLVLGPTIQSFKRQTQMGSAPRPRSSSDFRGLGTLAVMAMTTTAGGDFEGSRK